MKPSNSNMSFRTLAFDSEKYPILPLYFKVDKIAARSATLSWQPSASNPLLLQYYHDLNGSPDLLYDEEPKQNIEAPLSVERTILYHVSKSKMDSLIYETIYTGSDLTCKDLFLIPEQEYQFKIRCRWEDMDEVDPADTWSKEHTIVESETTNEAEMQAAILDLFKAVKLDDTKPIIDILKRFKDDFRMEQCDKEGKILSEIVCKSGVGDVMSVLIKNGANKNYMTMSGKSLVSLAVTHYNVSVLESLLRASSDPNTADNGGSTPLMWACQYSSSPEMIPIIKLLLTLGKVEVNIEDHFGLTAFDRLCQQTRGEILIAKMLIEAGARILMDPIKPHNMSSLMMASNSGNEKLCVLLINRKCKVRSVNCHDHTAIDFAKAKGFPDLAKSLALWGSKQEKSEKVHV